MMQRDPERILLIFASLFGSPPSIWERCFRLAANAPTAASHNLRA